jgi:hypothetical protein
MRLEGVRGIEVLALPLGYSCALVIHSILLFFFARKHLHILGSVVFRPLLQSSVSAFFAGYVAYVSLNYFVTLFVVDTVWTVLSQGFLAGLFGIFGYMLMQYVVRNQELREIYVTIKKRFSKEDVVVVQDEDTLAV